LKFGLVVPAEIVRLEKPMLVTVTQTARKAVYKNESSMTQPVESI